MSEAAVAERTEETAAAVAEAEESAKVAEGDEELEGEARTGEEAESGETEAEARIRQQLDAEYAERDAQKEEDRLAKEAAAADEQRREEDRRQALQAVRTYKNRAAAWAKSLTNDVGEVRFSQEELDRLGEYFDGLGLRVQDGANLSADERWISDLKLLLPADQRQPFDAAIDKVRASDGFLRDIVKDFTNRIPPPPAASKALIDGLASEFEALLPEANRATFKKEAEGLHTAKGLAAKAYKFGFAAGRKQGREDTPGEPRTSDGRGAGGMKPYSLMTTEERSQLTPAQRDEAAALETSLRS